LRNLPAATEANVIQFADDITDYLSGSDPLLVAKGLEACFTRTKDYCITRELNINVAKTQCIFFKIPNKKLPADLEVIIDGIAIKPTQSVKLLGVTLDHHLSFNEHIHNVTKKCHGLIGLLASAAPYLSKDLLRLAYIALIRSHLEYSSAIFASAAPTQLQRLEVIQKISSRVVCAAPRDAHAAPLLRSLSLLPLEDRRRSHIASLVQSILSGNCHPAFEGLFELSPEGGITNNENHRIKAGKKRFSIYARDLLNSTQIGPCNPTSDREALAASKTGWGEESCPVPQIRSRVPVASTTDLVATYPLCLTRVKSTPGV